MISAGITLKRIFFFFNFLFMSIRSSVEAHDRRQIQRVVVLKSKPGPRLFGIQFADREKRFSLLKW